MPNRRNIQSLPCHLICRRFVCAIETTWLLPFSFFTCCLFRRLYHSPAYRSWPVSFPPPSTYLTLTTNFLGLRRAFLSSASNTHHRSSMAGKNKSRSLKARGETSLNKYRGSGFEDGFADPPVTPMEHAAERQIYDPYVSFCVAELLSER